MPHDGDAQRKQLSDDVIGLYDRHAAAFDDNRGKNLFERQWLVRFTEYIPVHSTVLDLGCGSAEPISRFLIERQYRVTGIDSSAKMIAFCQERFPDHEWIHADMRDLDLGRRFGGILAWNSFFHLSYEDQRRMFDVFERHTMPNAPLMFTSGPAHNEAIGSLEGDALFHASLDPTEYRSLLAQHRYTVVDHRADDPDCNGHTIWLAKSA